jgi:hypothetical protein
MVVWNPLFFWTISREYLQDLSVSSLLHSRRPVITIGCAELFCFCPHRDILSWYQMVRDVEGIHWNLSSEVL